MQAAQHWAVWTALGYDRAVVAEGEDMRLVKDGSAGARAVSVPCVGENHAELNQGTSADFGQGARTRMFRLADGYADLDGKAFVDYYCDACAQAAKEE